jgi:predicted O-methyltransferase YrrM
MLDKIPYIGNLRRQIARQGAFPAGHYHSPIPDKNEVIAYVASRRQPPMDLPDVRLDKEAQFKLLGEYARFYEELPFPEKEDGRCRFYYDNGWFSYADAIFLFGFLRKHSPRRIIEVGSGFSSAVMLDTAERFFSQRPVITLIEPNPDRLNALLRGDDRERVRVVNRRVQEVQSELFLTLQAGDLLFIDSSHVLKCGSDLQVLMFEILPLLPPGVFVHFHDVFYPFDYPSEWLEEGRYWNENYFLRAFLSYNSEWSVYFFNTYVALAFGDYIRDRMPLCARNPGGSLYIRREARG